MRRLLQWNLALAACALGVVWAGRAAAEDKIKVELKVGDPAPTFTSIDDQGKEWKSADHVGKRILVVYFYPADLTGGCTKQACGFRDDYARLASDGVDVVGISGDTVENHQIFKKAKKLNFTLLADDKGEVAKKFGVDLKAGGPARVKDADGNDITLTQGVRAARWTFIIGKDGKIVYKDTNVKAAQDSKNILKFVEGLEK